MGESKTKLDVVYDICSLISKPGQLTEAIEA
jgi:hypothetical protein